ncbi:NAD(P)H-dependent oxidoreductase [Streptomyces sp. NPDC005549]|uniref:FMN-dependent NADH-azoreductase n=1 Tax=Streptomyces sp. NPDC005549 TaxID=3154888 RepID=UPI0033A8204C
MSYLLHIDSSSLGEASVSRQVARSLRDRWPGPVVHRGLAASPVPHLTAAGVTARDTAPSRHTPERAKAQALQDELIEEFLGAGAYLFTVPMYNLSMPSAFKAWLDQIMVMVMDRTFSHTGASPAAGRPAADIRPRRQLRPWRPQGWPGPPGTHAGNRPGPRGPARPGRHHRASRADRGSPRTGPPLTPPPARGVHNGHPRSRPRPPTAFATRAA